MPIDSLRIALQAAAPVSGLATLPDRPRALYVMAHGAGAGMAHPFMEAVATGLAERGVAVLRYQFPFMQSGSRRPDPPPVAHATVRAAVDAARSLLPGVPLLAGGKSFGARMTLQAQAALPLPGVVGLVAFGFPLHPAGKPSDARAAHLFGLELPMLLLQGDRDALAEPALLSATVARLSARATLHLIAGADHGFHVPKRSGRTDAEVLTEALDIMTGWAAGVLTEREHA